MSRAEILPAPNITSYQIKKISKNNNNNNNNHEYFIYEILIPTLLRNINQHIFFKIRLKLFFFKDSL
uniref:Uncharacterized protein n=1 Tax=Octopus bimaculoides TaxID=37653 RepID=A0A0L8FKN0_OCTBM